MKNKIIYIALGIIVCVFTFSVMTLNNDTNQADVATSGIILLNKIT